MTTEGGTMRYFHALAATIALALVAVGCSPQGAPSTTPTEGATTPVASEEAVERTVELVIAPAPVGQTEDGESGVFPAAVEVSPPAPGEDAVLQGWIDKQWTDVATDTQDGTGTTTFMVDVPSENGRMRFRAASVNADGKRTAVSEPAYVVNRKPVFSDDFLGDELDPEKWKSRQVGIRNPKGNRGCAESSKESVAVSDGEVQLFVSEIPDALSEQDGQGSVCPYGEFYNGHIRTAPPFAIRYGTLAARIQFAEQQGQHGAFWSQPTKSDGGAGSEIDIVEYFGDEFPLKGPLAGSSALQHSVFFPNVDGTQGKVGGLFDLSHLLDDGETWSDDFHVFSVEWTPSEYIFRVDGHETFRTSEGLSDEKQYLILSLLTSDWELPRLDPDAQTPMRIDWVRAWKPPPT